MGRIRTIKPTFTTDEDLSRLSAETHLLAAGLLCYADDNGFFNANPGLVGAAILPLRKTENTVEEMLTQLRQINYIRLGSSKDGKRWGQVVKFTIHQRINRPFPSKIKEIEIQWDNSVTTHAPISDDSLNDHAPISDCSLNTHAPITDDSLNDHAPISDDSQKNNEGIRKKEERRKKKESGMGMGTGGRFVAEAPKRSSRDKKLSPDPSVAVVRNLDDEETKGQREEKTEDGTANGNLTPPPLSPSAPESFTLTAPLTNAERAALKVIAEEGAIAELYGYYLECMKRNPKTHRLTTRRRACGRARLDDALRMSDDDLTDAVELMKAVIDEVNYSDFHMGRTAKTGGKTYCEWEDHIFNNTERFEKWVQQAREAVEKQKRRH